MLSIDNISYDELVEVYSQDFIKNLSYDNNPAKMIIHPAVKYYAARVNGEFAGAFMSIEVSDYEMELHCFILNKNIKQSRELSKLFISYIFESNNKLTRVSTKIMQDLIKVVNMCKKIGFTYEAKLKDSYIKDGKACDLHLLGLTKKEWGEL